MPSAVADSDSRAIHERKSFSCHLPIVLVLLFALFPLLMNLGQEHLWSDEGDTAVLARSILKHGVPKAWDGTTFTDSDYGQRVNRDLVMVSHPWLQYYVAAASFALFGESTFAARLPFAIAGWLTIAAIYFLVLRLTQRRSAALATAILLLFSVQFLLFSRECRNYPLAMLLTCVLLLLFFRLNSARWAVLFSLAGVLLFHSHPSAVAPLATLGLLTLIYKPFQQYRRWYWISAPFIAVLTAPWLVVAQAGYTQNSTMLADLSRLPARMVQFFFEWGSVTPIVGVTAMFGYLWWRHRRKSPNENKTKQKTKRVPDSLFSKGEKHLLVLISSLLVGYALLVAFTQSRMEMYNTGLRHVAAIIPLMASLSGLLISKISRGSLPIWVCLMLFFATTKLGRLSPWAFLQDERTFFDDSVVAVMHKPASWTDRIFRTSLIGFYYDLFHPNPGTVANICDFLNKNASSEDILITNYAWEPIYFHTGLRQGIKILPTYPIYELAQRHGLPNYNFTVEGTRWVVWRWAWQGYRDYDWEQVHHALIESGATVVKVASIPETTWENRSNVHFRRFPGRDYKYDWHGAETQPDAEIFRIDWPATQIQNLTP